MASDGFRRIRCYVKGVWSSLDPVKGREYRERMGGNSAVRFEFDDAKAVALLTYLASKPEEVTAFDKFKAGKLIYLADKYHLVRYGRPILGGEYRALSYGPVPQDALDLLNAFLGEDWGREGTPAVARLHEVLEIDRRSRYPRFTSHGATDLACLSRSEIVALDHIINEHGRKGFNELSALTHATAAYRNAWEAKPPGEKIAVMRYEDFFEEDSDALAGAFEEMIENDALRKSFPSAQGF